MRITGTTGTVLALVALAALGGGTYFFRTVQENRRLELQARIQQDRLKTKEAEALAKEAEAKTKESEARKAEAERKRAEAAAEEKRAVVAAKRQEEARAREQAAAATAAAKKATAEKAAADAAAKKAAAEKAASDAARAEQEKRAAAEAVVLQRAEAERKTAEAARDEKLAATRIAEAALAKSANERKAAEAAAAAEHDRKLRLYSRASLSRAETVALQRAERRLALEEAGLLAPEDNAGDGSGLYPLRLTPGDAGDRSEIHAGRAGILRAGNHRIGFRGSVLFRRNGTESQLYPGGKSQTCVLQLPHGLHAGRTGFADLSASNRQPQQNVLL